MHAILTRPDVYKVAVASAGSHRYESIYGQDLFFGPPDYGGTPLRPSPTARAAAYAAIDQVPLAPRLQGKLLLAYGGLDENVAPGGIVPMIEAFEKAGKTFDLVYLPNANHGFGGESAYFRKRMFDYFVEHLGELDARREH
jgi:dipeptidyl-peptidase-4